MGASENCLLLSKKRAAEDDISLPSKKKRAAADGDISQDSLGLDDSSDEEEKDSAASNEVTPKNWLRYIESASSTSKKPSSRIQPVTHPRSSSTEGGLKDDDEFELDFSEVKDYPSFKQIFLTDRESGSERTGWYNLEFPEDWLKDYYRVCFLEKRFLHGKRYSILGKQLVDAFIKTIVEIFRTTIGIVRLEVSKWDYEELKKVKLLVLQCEKGGFALGLLGKIFLKSVDHKENMMQLEKDYKEAIRELQGLLLWSEQMI